MIDRIVEALPGYLHNHFVGAAIIVAGALVAAWVVDFVVGRLLRSAASRTRSTVDDRLVSLVHVPIRTTVFLAGLAAAVHYVEFPAGPTRFAVASFNTIGVIVWMVFAIRFINLLLTSMSQATRFRFVEPRTAPLFDNIARIVIVGVAIYFLFLFWGIEVTAWLASAGVVGIAVGFAAKDTLANLFSGIFILADAPYQVGDTINLDSGDRGVVTHVGLRSTRLVTRDDVEITLPNAVIANAKIVNESRGPYQKHRIRVGVGVAYGSDVDLVTDVLTRVGVDNEHTCEDPEPRARFRQFGESSLDFELLCWIEDPQTRGLAIHELNMAIYKRFAEEGIQIPFPQRDLWVKQMPKGLE